VGTLAALQVCARIAVIVCTALVNTQTDSFWLSIAELIPDDDDDGGDGDDGDGCNHGIPLLSGRLVLNAIHIISLMLPSLICPSPSDWLYLTILIICCQSAAFSWEITVDWAVYSGETRADGRRLGSLWSIVRLAISIGRLSVFPRSSHIR